MESSATTFAFGARECDVRMVGTRLGHESAQASCRCHPLLKGKQARSLPDTGENNSGAIEDSKCINLYWNRRKTQLAKPRVQALIFLRNGIAQELQRNMPRCGRRPAQSIALGSKTR